MVEPIKALEKAGIKATIISPEKEKVTSWTKGNWGQPYNVDIELDKANPAQFDALILPGGVMNPDSLRTNEKAISFIRHFVDNNKPISAICHGPWTLINAGGVAGHTITSWPSLKNDLTNAGATWVDDQVVRDGKLVTSRKPEDLEAFNKVTLDLLAEIVK